MYVVTYYETFLDIGFARFDWLRSKPKQNKLGLRINEEYWK